MGALWLADIRSSVQAWFRACAAGPASDLGPSSSISLNYRSHETTIGRTSAICQRHFEKKERTHDAQQFQLCPHVSLAHTGPVSSTSRPLHPAVVNCHAHRVHVLSPALTDSRLCSVTKRLSRGADFVIVSAMPAHHSIKFDGTSLGTLFSEQMGQIDTKTRAVGFGDVSVAVYMISGLLRTDRM
jgi:hypothetical protein